MEKINIRNMYIELLNKIRNVEGVDKDYVDGLIEVVDQEITALDSDINALISVVPEEASATNPLVVTDDLAAVAFSGSYNDLDNKPTIPAAQVNSDWNASSGVAEILNKPTVRIPVTQNITVETSFWFQVTGENYYEADIYISDNFDTDNLFLVDNIPTDPDIRISPAAAAAYALVFGAKTNTVSGHTSICLFANAMPANNFDIQILYYY